ncbi:MAG: hypothetical protein AABY22_22630 [Nanoarchaeota archaeon]
MILAFDISTAAIGVALLNADGTLHSLDVIDLSKIKTGLFDKAAIVKVYLTKIKLNYKINNVYIEEALVKMRRGKSTAATISTLLKFNGICSYIIEEVLSIKPVFILAPHARKVCGMIVTKQEKKRIGIKPIVMNHVISLLGSQFEITRTRTGSVKSTTYDRADSYILALAGYKKFHAATKQQA